MKMPSILARAVDQKPEHATERATTSPGTVVTVPYTSGAVGSVQVQLFWSNDDEDRGGHVIRLTVQDGGSSLIPTATHLPDGVDLHLPGDAEGAAFLSAIAGLITAHSATCHSRGVGV